MFLSLSGRGKAEWIIAFLGNPGAKYASTRHNAGFMAADEFEKRFEVKLMRMKFKALTELCTVEGKRVLAMKPQTYMNLSGEAVQPAAAFYKIPPERVIVICDDINLPPGKLRVRRNGSAGGHNGLKSIISRLGTEDFPRIKIGVGRPADPDGDVVDWVIGGVKNAEYELMEETAKRAVLAAEEIIANGVDSAMNRYNG